MITNYPVDNYFNDDRFEQTEHIKHWSSKNNFIDLVILQPGNKNDEFKLEYLIINGTLILDGVSTLAGEYKRSISD